MDQLLKSKYRIGKKLSENPFSVTYQGFLIGTDKPVIIKIYKRGTLSSSLIREMKRKVKDFSLLNHHGIAKLLDGDYGWQGFYYVREFIDGRSLQEYLARGDKFGVDKAGDIMDQVLAALEVVHAKGIIHAALKPANIFIDNQGLIRLVDFVIEGEVKEAMPQKALEIMENADYSPPEQIEGKTLCPASDVYSLGLIFYELALGKPALEERGIAGNIQKIRSPVCFSKEALAGLPRYAMEIIMKAVDKDPLLRFSSAKEFRESLLSKNIMRRAVANEEYLKIFESVVTQYGGEELGKELENPLEVGKLRWGKEKHRNWILAMVVAVAVALGVVYAFFFGR